MNKKPAIRFIVKQKYEIVAIFLILSMLSVYFTQIDDKYYGFIDSEKDPYEWHRTNNLDTPQGDDYIHYLILTKHLLEDNHKNIFNLDRLRPPLMFIPTSIAILIFGFSITQYLSLNLLWYLVLLICLYKITSHYTNKKFGVLILLLFFSLPHTHTWLLNIYGSDLPLLSMCALVLLVMLKYPKLKTIKIGIVVGSLIGLTLLTRHIAAIYFLLPVTLYLLKNIKFRKNLAILMVALLIVGGWFYVINFPVIYCTTTKETVFTKLVPDEKLKSVQREGYNFTRTRDIPKIEEQISSFKQKGLIPKLGRYLHDQRFTSYENFLFIFSFLLTPIYLVKNRKTLLDFKNLVLWTIPPYLALSLLTDTTQARFMLPVFYTQMILMITTIYIILRNVFKDTKITWVSNILKKDN